MFLETNLTYNENGDISEIIKSGAFYDPDFKYTKTKLIPKDKYVQLYRARLKAKKAHPLQNREFRELREIPRRALIRRASGSYDILGRYYRSKKSGKPLQPFHVRLEKLLTDNRDQEFKGQNEMIDQYVRGWTRGADMTPEEAKDYEILMYQGLEFSPFDRWNVDFADPSLRIKTKKEIEAEKRERQYLKKWAGVTARLPKEYYDPERFEWIQRERPMLPGPREVGEEEEIAQALRVAPEVMEQIREEEERLLQEARERI